MSEDKLQVEVVSKTRPLWSGYAHYVSVPAIDGRLGILTGRQPLLAVLDTGEVEIQREDREPVILDVNGGFVSVDSDFVTVVVEDGARIRNQ